MRFNSMVRAYFHDKTRTFVYGKFVELKDAKDLKSKGMVRFVSHSKIDDFDKDNHVMFTRIFIIKSFKNFIYYAHQQSA